MFPILHILFLQLRISQTMYLRSHFNNPIPSYPPSQLHQLQLQLQLQLHSNHLSPPLLHYSTQQHLRLFHLNPHLDPICILPFNLLVFINLVIQRVFVNQLKQLKQLKQLNQCNQCNQCNHPCHPCHPCHPSNLLHRLNPLSSHPPSTQHYRDPLMILENKISFL